MRTTRYAKSKLQLLLDEQLDRLDGKGLNPIVLVQFEARREALIEIASNRPFGKNRLPFLPVIPSSILGLNEQMTMVFHEGQKGKNCLDQNDICIFTKTPSGVYFIVDVENGESTLGKNALVARQIISAQNRKCATVCEIISLGIQTDVLGRHSLNATGSQSISDNCAIARLQIFGRVPMLRLGFSPNFYADLGSPSCALRV